MDSFGYTTSRRTQARMQISLQRKEEGNHPNLARLPVARPSSSVCQHHPQVGPRTRHPSPVPGAAGDAGPPGRLHPSAKRPVTDMHDPRLEPPQTH